MGIIEVYEKSNIFFLTEVKSCSFLKFLMQL